MIPLYHVAHRPCYGPAFGVKKQCALTEGIEAENVVKFDGKAPRTGEGLICGTCRRPVHRSWLSYTIPERTR